MLGDFINRLLILILGYAYPGFECYKVVEKNKVDIEELRFWCKYWIIVALFTVMEKFVDIFVGWLPMYGETKLVLFVYLWYPKTKGTGYIYEIVLKPLVSRHENEIDRKILELKARAWDQVACYWTYFAQYGHTAFVQALQYVVSQSTKISTNQTTTTQKNEAYQSESAPESSAPSSLKMKSSSFSKSKKVPSSPPSTNLVHRKISGVLKTKTTVDPIKEHVEEEEEEEEEAAAWESEPATATTEDGMDENVKDRISRARARLKRLETQNSRSPRTPLRRD